MLADLFRLVASGERTCEVIGHLLCANIRFYLLNDVRRGCAISLAAEFIYLATTAESAGPINRSTAVKGLTWQSAL